MDGWYVGAWQSKESELMKYWIYYTLWTWWHSKIRHWYDVRFNDGYYFGGNRPFWHVCCNGDAGGWRTDICNYLEHKWRDIEADKQKDEA